MPTNKRVSFWSHLKAIVALPFMVIIVIPFLLNHLYEPNISSKVGLSYIGMLGAGIFIMIPGLFLFINALILFHKIGNGTLAPWNPTKKLVVKHLYRHTRNPMISGVLCLLLAESLFYDSLAIMIWFLTFFSITTLFFILFEEPDLEKRFGEEYKIYKENVPRWIPRIRGWKE